METVVNHKLIIEYDGTDYAGWQRQLGHPTVQQTIEEAIFALTGQQVRIIGASRTDAGVHAAGQTANVRLCCDIPPEKLAYALNSHLPHDIRIKSSCAVPDRFHAQYDALRKRYLYQIYYHPQGSALLCRTHWILRAAPEPDIEAMRRTASCFVGTHDFAAFCAAGGQVKTTVRTLYRSEWLVDKAPYGDGDRYTFLVEGNGFLYNMVRIMVGTMVGVGRGKLREADVPRLLAQGDRRLMGQTAPPQGLCLQRIWYNE